MKRIITASALITSALLLGGWFGGGSEKQYMDVDTEEYQSVTAKTFGDWKVESYIYKGEEQIGKLYKQNGKVTFDFESTTFSLQLSLLDQIITDETPAWKEWEPHKDILVTSYDIVVTSDSWEIVDHGDNPMVKLSDMSTEITAQGSGIPSMEEFGAKEVGKISSITAASKAGSGIGGGSMFGDMVGGFASKLAEKTTEEMVGSADYLKPSVLMPNYMVTFDGDKMILSIGRDEDLKQFILVK